MRGSNMRRNTIVTALMVLALSAGIGLVIGGGGVGWNSGGDDRPDATPVVQSATPYGTPVSLPPYFGNTADSDARIAKDLTKDSQAFPVNEVVHSDQRPQPESASLPISWTLPPGNQESAPRPF